MGRRSPIRLGFALAVVLVVQITLAREDKCRSGCQGGPQNVKFAEGTTYKYNYEGKIDISLSSAEGQTTSTDIKAEVLLTQLPECNQILRLRHVQVLGAGGKKYGQIPDIEKPVKLNLHTDGQLEDSICVEQGDSQNSINIKRAIASLFQADAKHGYETDVFGRCPTEVSTHKDGNVLVIQKSRNLNKCAYRENIKQDFLATTFNLHSEIKSSPILNADYEATLKVKNGILDQATVQENYLYVPFSVGKNGAKAQVNSKLQFTGTSKDTPKNTANKPRSIIFENPHPVNSPTGNVNTILQAVKETAKTIDITVSETTAKEFVNLIKILRVSKKDDILTVYNQVKSGVGFTNAAAAKKIFLDALLRAGNGNSVEVAIALLKNRQLNEAEQRLVYLGLSFVRHATEESVRSAIELLSQPNLPREAYLGIGNLAGRYCRQHSCENVESINKLSQALILKLADGKAANRKEENEMIFVLKALANVHYLNDNILSKITAIAQDKKAPNRLRVAALEAFLADPCKDKLRDSALNVLQDIQQDSEVRIRAYLTAVQCPNAKIGNAIKALLEKEPSYQVGGFIVSHIRNIKASANPDKELAKQHLAFLSLPKKFPIDFRKWSYNGEFSYSVDTLGVASSAETNIIYSQKSWLPRSSNLNLTAEVFGHTFNFLEIETRQENLDKLIEHYFGPKGVLRTASFNELWNSNQKSAKDILNHLKSELSRTLRARRDVTKAEIDNIGKQVQIRTNELNNDLDLDISVKAFGSELLFLSMDDDIQKWTPTSIIDKLIAEFATGLDKLKNFEESLRSNLLFLDAEFAYPTSLGVPLRLAVEGTSNVQIKTKGKIDVRALLNDKDSVLKLSVIPSANIEIAGRLTADAFVVENGLKVISTLYSSTGGDLTIDFFNRHNGVDVKFGLPVEKQELISANHEIVFHTRELGAREQNTPLKFSQQKDFSICFDQLSNFIGLTFCGEINGPDLSGKKVPILPFPLAGDAKASISIERNNLKEFHFRNVFSPTDLDLVVEAIDQNGKPKVSLLVKAAVNPTDKYITATLLSPIKQASAEARLTTNDKEQSLLLRLTHDKSEYSGKIGVQIEGTAARSVYKPILEIKAPNGAQNIPYNIQGQIIVERNGPDFKYTFDNVRAEVNKKAVTLKGHLGRDGQAIYTDLTLTDGAQSGTLKGRLQATQNLIKFNAEVQNSLNPNANFNIKGELKKQPGQYDSSLQIIHGQDLSSKTNILTLTNSFTKKEKSTSTKNKLSYPLLGVEGKFEFEHTPNTLDYELDIQYNEVKVGSELDLKYNEKEVGDYQVEFDLWGLENRLELKASRQIQNEESKIANTLVVNGKKVEVSGKIKHHIKPTIIDVGADLVIIVPTHSTPFKVVNGLKWNPSDIDAFQKVSSGNNVVIDIFLKANKAGNANGSIKVNLKNILVVNGQLKANKGVGNGDILIDVQSIKRQVKAETTFTVQTPTTYNIELTIYPSFHDNKNQKLVLSTHNKVSSSSVDSKNVVDILGHKFDLNVKGSKTGELGNGKVNGEVELTLPNEQYLVGKLNMDRSVVHGIINGNGQGSLELRKNKNAPGRKISWKGQVKDSDPKEHIFDLNHSFSADNGEGKTLNADLKLLSRKNGETREYDVKTKLSGSVLSHPLEYSLTGHCNDKIGQYETRTTYGPNAIISLKGAYDVTGQGKPISGEVKLDVSSPSKILKTLQVGLSGSFKKPQDPSDHLELQGSANIFADDDGTKPEAIIDLKSSGSLKVNDKDGQVQGSLTCGKHHPISVTLGYNRKEDDKQKQLNANFAVQYDQGKNIKGDISVGKQPGNHHKLVAELQTPYAGHKTNKLVIDIKRSDDQKHTTMHGDLACESLKWTGDCEWTVSDLTPSFDLKVKSPEGKLSQIYYKQNKVSNKQFSNEFKMVHEKKDFLYESSLDANVESADDFLIKAYANSPALKINKVEIEIHNKPGKTGRRIQVTGKSDGKNYLSGSTSYTTREENGKYIVEGAGSFKVKEETKSANFKYMMQRLRLDQNGEEGIEFSLDARLGNEAVDAEFKATNKQFRILNSFCEEKKQCAHIEIDSKTNTNDLHNYNQVLEIAIDLRKLGLSHEFGMKAVTTRKDWILDHTVDVHFQSQENSKYQYSLYLHPKEAGWTLTTPKRIVALEAKAEYPRNIREGGKVSGDVAFYLDKKNQPNKKTSLNGWLDIDMKGHKINGETKFTHPGLQRALTSSIKTIQSGTPTKGEISIVAELDIFAQPAQKVVTTFKTIMDIDPKNKYNVDSSFKIHSSGLGIDIVATEEAHIDRAKLSGDYAWKLKYQVGNSRYNNALTAKLSKTHTEFLIRILNVDLLKASSELKLSKQEQIVDTEISSYNNVPMTSHLEIKNWNTLKYNLGHKNANKKIQFSSGLIPGQIADIRADFVDGGNKVNLFHATIKLDEANFLKSDYGVDSKQIEKVLKEGKDKVTNYVQGLKEVTKEWSNDARKEATQIGDIAKRATPNLKPLKDYYSAELKKIKDEVLSDKTIKDISELVKNLFGIVAKSLGELFEKFSAFVESVVHAFQTSFAKVFEIIDKELLPQLKSMSDKIITVMGEILNTTADVALAYFAKISKVLEEFQPEFKKIGAALGELSQDVGRFVLNLYENGRAVVLEQWKKISTEIKALPIFDELKSQYEEFVKNGLPNAEAIVKTLKEVTTTIKDAIPDNYPEIKDLITTIVNYIEAKVKNQKVDDAAVIDKIIKITLNMLKKIIGSDSKVDLRHGSYSPSLHFLTKLPRLVAIKFSPFAHLYREEAEGAAAFILSLFTKPRNWIAPFPLEGLIVQGQHIFTFDGKHITFPGKCNYLLARDAVHGNFTIAGTYTNGLLTSITLADHKDSITLKKGGQILFNNAATELPIRIPSSSNPQLAAYRTYELIYLRSNAGVNINCVPSLIGCRVIISGFYHGQLKGLLGNGNNEPYDDFTLPNGKIVPTESEFGNAYKMTSSCPAITLPEHKHIDNPVCNKLFGWESSLRYCYSFVNPDNFKMACAHGLAAGVKDTEEAIAKAYVSACNSRNIPIHMPNEFVKCTNSEKPFAVGDKFSVKTPGKSADIVLLVDTIKSNELIYKELVQPLVTEVAKDLSSKGVSDVEFHLITYGGENLWPSHVTVGGKLTFKGKAPKIKFSEEPKKDEKLNVDPTLDPIIETLRSISHDLKLALGLNLQAETYSSGLSYPFRAQAIKSIIVATSKPCEVGKLIALQKLHALLFRNDIIKLNLITPFAELQVKDIKKTKDVVGFNSENVFTLSQAKNKKPEGNSELYKDLQYDDYCVDFTIKNNGNVFVSDNFRNAKGEDRKQFVQVAAHNIADYLTRSEEGADCECQMINPYKARNVCENVYSKEKTGRKGVAKG